MPDEPLTLQNALRYGAERLALREDLRDCAKQDAQQLLEIATGRSRVQMLAQPYDVLSAAERERLDELLQRRLQAEPVQYLRGSQEFYGRDFLVSPDVLIPRPETEDIITAVLERTPDRTRPLRIADVGTGSGILAIILALELPNSNITAIDISPAALLIAERNTERLAKEHDATAMDRIHFVHSDLFAAVPAGGFDVIVSNPPYIPLAESPFLHPQVREYEPHLALFSGEDGHDIFRRLISESWNMLISAGFLVMETAGRIDLLHKMLSSWSNVTFRLDLQGMQRVVVATKP